MGVADCIDGAMLGGSLPVSLIGELLPDVVGFADPRDGMRVGVDDSAAVGLNEESVDGSTVGLWLAAEGIELSAVVGFADISDGCKVGAALPKAVGLLLLLVGRLVGFELDSTEGMSLSELVGDAEL